MGDSIITIVAIILAAILMFIFPLMSISDRSDDVSQLVVTTATTEFVDNVRTTGTITYDNYSDFVQTLAATGHTFDVELKAQILDENPGKKTTQTDSTKIGENVYYEIYTSQILETIETGDTLAFKEGDIFTATVENTDTTLSQQLKSILYSVSGGDIYTIAASHGGLVTTNGN